MRRLLFISHHPVFGGPENQALRLAEPLASRGWRTLVALTNEEGNSVARLRDGGLEVVQLPLHRLRGLDKPRELAVTGLLLAPEVAVLRRLIRARDIDLVLVPGLENPHGALAARSAGVPVVWQLLGTRTPLMFRRAMAPLVTVLAGAIMPTGRSLLDHHPGLGGLQGRVVPFFPPVDTSLFAPDHLRRAAARHELGFDEHDIVVGNVANINAQKDHVTFVRAAAALRRGFPEVRFLMIGETAATQRRYEEEIWREAARLGLRRGVELMHAAPGARVAELASALDIFWLTSEARSEGVPTAMMEAMALEVPVVATRVGSVAEVLTDGQGGFLVEPKDSEGLARRSQPLVSDPAARHEQGRRARRVILDRAGLETCVDSHLRAFNVALGRQPKGQLGHRSSADRYGKHPGSR